MDGDADAIDYGAKSEDEDAYEEKISTFLWWWKSDDEKNEVEALMLRLTKSRRWSWRDVRTRWRREDDRRYEDEEE